MEISLKQLKKISLLIYVYLLLFSCKTDNYKTNKNNTFKNTEKNIEQFLQERIDTILWVNISIKNNIFKKGEKKLQGKHLLLDDKEDLYNYQIYNFKDGYLDGVSLYFTDNILRKKEEYKKGELSGIYEVFDVNGKIIYSTNFKNGTGYIKEYNEFGELIEEGKFTDGLQEGKWITYYEDSNLQKDSIVKIEFFKKGILSSEKINNKN